jgi:hypothetical protein
VIVALLLCAPVDVRAEPTRSLDIEWFGTDDPTLEMDLCVLLPYEHCRRTLDARIGYGGGRGYRAGLQPDEPNEYMQLYVDGGFLFQVVDSPSVQVGPTVGAEIEIFDETLRYHLFSTALFRIWAGRWITFDAAVGIVGSFDDEWHPRGIGGIGEAALTLHAHLGLYVQTQVIAGSGETEVLVTGGFRGSLVAWLVIFLGMSG